MKCSVGILYSLQSVNCTYDIHNSDFIFYKLRQLQQNLIDMVIEYKILYNEYFILTEHYSYTNTGTTYCLLVHRILHRIR